MSGIGSGGIGQALTSQGIITPEQISLAQYGAGQDTISQMAKFSQIPQSTNLTQAVSGARAGEALQIGQESQADVAAQTKFLNQQFGNLTGGIGSILGSLGSIALKA